MQTPTSSSSADGRRKDGNDRPSPLHCICRPDGAVVPLIAADDLPPGVQIQGIPRYYRCLGDATGLISLGPVPKRGGHYVLEIGRAPGHSLSAASSPRRAPDVLVMEQERAKQISSSAKVTCSTQKTTENREASSPPLDVVKWAPTSSHHRSSSAISRQSKTYCTHWIFHGECAFVHSSRGCRFKHEMPHDPAVMAQVGLKSHPKWWIDRQSVVLKGADWRAPEKENPRPGADPALPFALPPAPSCPSSPRSEARPTRLFGHLFRPTPPTAPPPPAPTVEHEQPLPVGLGLDLSGFQSHVPAVVSPPIRFYSTSHTALKSPPLPSTEGSQSPQEICNASFSGDFDPRPRPESARERGGLRQGRGRLSLFDLPLRNQALLAQNKLSLRAASESASRDQAIAVSGTERASRPTVSRHAHTPRLSSALDTRSHSYRPSLVASLQRAQTSDLHRTWCEPSQPRLELNTLPSPSGNQSLVERGSDRPKLYHDLVDLDAEDG